MDSPASDFFSGSNEDTSTPPDVSSPNLRTLSNPLEGESATEINPLIAPDEKPVSEPDASTIVPNTNPKEAGLDVPGPIQTVAPPTPIDEIPIINIPTPSFIIENVNGNDNNDKKLSKQDVDELCDASEDYKAIKNNAINFMII